MGRKRSEPDCTLQGGLSEAGGDEGVGATCPRSDADLGCLLEEAHAREAQLERANRRLEDLCQQQENRLNRYADLWDQAPVGYLDLDRDGAIVHVNLTAASMLWTPRLALAGQPLSAWIEDSSVPVVAEFLDRVFGGWEVAVCEFLVLSANGDRRVLRIKGSADADARECRAVLMDVTTLRHTEMRFNQLAGHIEQAYWVADRGVETFVYLSSHCHELMGVDCTDFVRNPVVRQTLVHPDDLDRHEAAMLAAREGAPIKVEYRLQHPEKGLRWLRVRTFPFEENGQPMNAGLVEDITAQKQAEQSRLDGALRLRDALTREVHHRIKNNLQTVVGLLRREAGRYPQAREPIEAALAQVQSVAVVHGLSSRDGLRDIMLCELLPAVVSNVSELYGANIVRVDESTGCGRLQVKESETVALALILNELVTNAIKHAPGESGAAGSIRVTMAREGARGCIRVTNSGRLPSGFDFAAGSGLGTGLGLVKVLIPPAGLALRFEQTEGLVVELLVEPPVLSMDPSATYTCEGQTYEQCTASR